MSSIQIDLSPDLRRLREEGYNIYIHKGPYLVVRDVPYVNAQREVRIGAFVCSLDLAGDIATQPTYHTMKFIGDYPCDSGGAELGELRHQSGSQDLGNGLVVQHEFSRKPGRGHYVDYYEKVTHYVSLLESHAIKIDPGASARTGRVFEPEADESPFHYLDTASARAEINVITQKLESEAVAIIGLGGTGSYVLDLVAKTPVWKIHIYDSDRFLSHNAFRAPGAASIDELRKQHPKVEYYKVIYSRMHRGIVEHAVDINETNVDELRGMSFVFLCMDGGQAKKLIIEKLEEYGIPFVDATMGLYAKRDTIGGSLQTVTSLPGFREAAKARISFTDDSELNEYDKNIQIADLNALNACLAVIRWKKTRQFYFDRSKEQFTCYNVGGNLIINEDIP